MQTRELIISLLQDIVGDEWEVRMTDTLVIFHLKEHHTSYYDFIVNMYDNDGYATFEVSQSGYDEPCIPNSNSKVSKNYKAKAALISNPCIPTIIKLFDEICPFIPSF